MSQFAEPAEPAWLLLALEFAGLPGGAVVGRPLYERLRALAPGDEARFAGFMDVVSPPVFEAPLEVEGVEGAASALFQMTLERYLADPAGYLTAVCEGLRAGSAARAHPLPFDVLLARAEACRRGIASHLAEVVAGAPRGAFRAEVLGRATALRLLDVASLLAGGG